MQEKIMAIVDGIRCAEQKIGVCRTERDALSARIASLDEAIAYQMDSKRRYEQDLTALLLARDDQALKRKMLSDLAAQRESISRKIEELEAETVV